MTRPSPIIIGSVALSILILGTELYAIHRSRHRVRPAAAEEPTVEPPSRASPESPIVAALPATPAPSPPSPPIPADDSFAAERAGSNTEAAVGKRPLFVAPNTEEVIRDADEHAFNVLKMPEATRAAVRRINQEHAAKVQALRNGGGVDLSAGPQVDTAVTNSGATQTRGVALAELLGVDAAQRFHAAEQAATKRLHNRYRWQSLHGVPPGTPPSGLPPGRL